MTTGWNEVAWNKVVMAQSDRKSISHLCPRVEVSNFSRSTLNEKVVFSRLIKVASLTIFCVPLPSYNFIVSIKDNFYCGYFALRDER